MEEEKEREVGKKVKIKREVKVKGSNASGGKTSAPGVTERDVEVVRWLGRHKLATAELVMERFGMQRSKTYQRLAALTDAGLVRHEVGVRTSRVYLATARGLAVAGLDLPTGRVSAATSAHDLAVVRAAIPLERSRLSTVLTEREFRRLDQDQPGRFRITHAGLPGAADQRGLWPDLVTIDHVDHSMHAVEVELTQKKRERVLQKLHAYAASHCGTITYICGTPPVARVVPSSDPSGSERPPADRDIDRSTQACETATR